MPSDSRRMVVRGSGGLFFDRVPLRAVGNALLSAGNTTDLTNLRQITINLSPQQQGAPVFPNILTAPCRIGDASEPDDDGSEHPECVFASGELRGGASGRRHRHGERRLSVRARAEPDHPGEPERADLRRRRARTMAAGRIRTTRTTISIRPRPSRTITGCTCRSCSGQRAWGHYRVSYTLSKSMNNVGETFFSSPIDPADLSKDWGRSDDDQRHRFVVNGAVNSAVRHRCERRGAGVFVAAVQHHVRPDDDSGDAGEADRERRVHRAERGRRQRFLQCERTRREGICACRRRRARRGD